MNNTDRFDPRLWRLNTKQARRLATLDTAPELPLSRDNEVLIKRIRMGGDLDPFVATGNHLCCSCGCISWPPPLPRMTRAA